MSRSEEPPERALSVQTDPPAEAWEFDEKAPYAGLTIHQRGAPLAKAKTALVLFHGYGADGSDLVGLHRVLDVDPDVALLFPEAPVALPTGGRAWFRRDRVNFEMGVRRARALIVDLKNEFPKLSFVVGGFSQGAMLAANLVQLGDLEIVAGMMFSPADQLLSVPSRVEEPVPLLVSHGTVDNVLPFSGAESLRDKFLGAGHEVQWVPFEGRHQIPRQVIDAANSFLAALTL